MVTQKNVILNIKTNEKFLSWKLKINFLKKCRPFSLKDTDVEKRGTRNDVSSTNTDDVADNDEIGVDGDSNDSDDEQVSIL